MEASGKGTSMRSSLLLFALLASTLAPAARAALIRVDFAGVVDDVVDDYVGVPGFEPLLDGSIVVGTLFSGYALYEDTQSPEDSTPTSARYVFVTPPGELEVSVGNYTAVAGPLGPPYGATPGFQIDLQNGFSDSYYVFTTAVLAAGDIGGSGVLAGTHFSFYVDDTSATALASTALADVPISLASWSFSQFEFIIEDDLSGLAAVHGSLTSLTATVVPEPATWLLVAIGCAGLAGRRGA